MGSRLVVSVSKQAIGVAEREGHARLLLQHHLDQARVTGIVLDQQDALAVLLGLHLQGGSVTTLSQKRSIDCTTTMNFSRSTGLVT